MAKVGRNDPCPCGSGKKYKQCHLPIEQAAEVERRALRQAQDPLFARLMEEIRERAVVFPEAMQQFWDGRYTVEQMGDIDDEEPRGAERFLTWVVFDYHLDDGRTLVETLADDPSPLGSGPHEAMLLDAWRGVRLRPYLVADRVKGTELHVRDMLDNVEYRVVDHAASRRVEPGEVLVGHLVPVADDYYIAGAAAHLTEDTREKLAEFAALHLEAFQREQPDATWADMLRARSHVLNHFIMQLPTEQPDPRIMDDILTKTRVALAFAGESLGRKGADEAPGEAPEDEHQPIPRASE